MAELNIFKSVAVIAVIFWLSICCAIGQQGPYGVHDPVLIREDSTYYLFCTGKGISSFSSPDKIHWKQGPPVFSAPPDWTLRAVPGYQGYAWAPDIFFYKGRYWLLYSVSAFGKNTSCIGLAENATLDPMSKDFNWIDHGKLIQSIAGSDNWNAIDPNFVVDKNGQPWITFGSFWSGIKLVKVKKDLSGVAQPAGWYALAQRPGSGAIEAPFIFRKNDYYYLFVSFDFCCRGVNSNYKVMVGRSKDLKGPYFDRNGVSMNAGGGTPVVVGNKRYPGVGHCAVYTYDGCDYIIFHGYDSKKDGHSRLLIEKLTWDSDHWPSVPDFH